MDGEGRGLCVLINVVAEPPSRGFALCDRGSGVGTMRGRDVGAEVAHEHLTMIHTNKEIGINGGFGFLLFSVVN